MLKPATHQSLTPTTLASKVIEQRIEETSTQQKMKKDPSFDDVLGRTTHKSDGIRVLVIRTYNVEENMYNNISLSHEECVQSN